MTAAEFVAQQAKKRQGAQSAPKRRSPRKPTKDTPKEPNAQQSAPERPTTLRPYPEHLPAVDYATNAPLAGMTVKVRGLPEPLADALLFLLCLLLVNQADQ